MVNVVSDSGYYYFTQHTHAYNGWLGCEFFFILSGYFMSMSLKTSENMVDDGKNKNDAFHESWNETMASMQKHLFHCVKSIWGIYLLSSLQGCIIRNIFGMESDWLTQVKAIPGELFLLQCLGVPVSSYTGVAWYLSAYLIAIFFIYPLLRRHFDVYSKYIAPIVSLAVWSTILVTYGTLSVIMNWIGPFNCGVLRAVAAMSWGCFISSHAVNFDAIKKQMRILLTIIELTLYGFIFYLMYIDGPEDRSWDSFILILILFASAITLSEISYSEKVFKLSIFGYLGKFSKYLFLNHFYWALVLPTTSVANAGKWVYFVLSICSSMIVYTISELIRKLSHRKLETITYRK